MDLGCIQWGLTAASTSMTPHHHLGSTITPIPKIWPPPPQTQKCNAAPICPPTAYEGAQTLYIHPIWMWDGVCITSRREEITEEIDKL